jgi:hypothetical protein
MRAWYWDWLVGYVAVAGALVTALLVLSRFA